VDMSHADTGAKHCRVFGIIRGTRFHGTLDGILIDSTFDSVVGCGTSKRLAARSPVYVGAGWLSRRHAATIMCSIMRPVVPSSCHPQSFSEPLALLGVAQTWYLTLLPRPVLARIPRSMRLASLRAECRLLSPVTLS